MRPARMGDVPAMAALLGELFSREADFSPDRARQERALSVLLADPSRGRLFVLEEEGRVTGMVSLLLTVSTAEGGTAAWLEDMVVEEGRRGGGRGGLLLDRALRWAREAGVSRVTLLTDGDNGGARRFYARRGFAPSSMVPMRKALRAGDPGRDGSPGGERPARRGAGRGVPLPEGEGDQKSS